MAKKKSMEELLDEAIVKDIPYEVPENWSFIKFNNILSTEVNSLKRGPFGSAIKKDYFVPSGYKVYEQKNAIYNDMSLGNYYVNEEKYKELEAFAVNPGDIIVSCSGTVGKIALVPEESEKGIINQALLKISLNEEIINKKFFLNLFVSEPFNSKIIDDSRGSAIKNIAGTKLLKEVAVPIPPMKEQERIVERIESLFEKLDKSLDLIQEARDGFETRKAAILEKAFEGELTSHYRKNNCLQNGWKSYKLNEIAKLTSGGTPSRAIKEYYTGNIPWIKTGEIDWNNIYDSEEHITEEAVKNSSTKLIPANSVLVAMYGQGLTRGRAAILKRESCTNQAVCALIPTEKIETKFLYYYFMKNYWRFREAAKGGNQENLSGKVISGFEIELPHIEEQKEIIYILDKILEEEDKIEELAQLEEQIELIKKSILAKAFRGELGTNRPEEDSAVELLKSILR